MTIQQRLLESFTKHSQNIALIHNGINLNYDELYTAAIKIAEFLAKQKLEGASISLIYTDKLQLIIAMLGVILSLNAFVPIPIKTPHERIKRILEISNTQFILSDQELDFNTNIEYCNSVKILCSAPISGFNPKVAHPDDVSHVYFTSGSTGEPKGIKGRHASLLSFMLWMTQQFEINSSDVVLQLSSEGFSLFKREVLATFISGATLCIPGDEDKSSFTAMAEFISGNNITLINTVPSYYNYLINYLSEEQHPNLRVIFTAGEILYKSLVNKHIQAFNHECRLVNLYGPTETTQAKFYYEIDPYNLNFGDIVPVGIPINDVTRAFIRDEDGSISNIPGIKAEVLIKTRDMSYGYCDSTQNLPFIEIDGQKAFVTGDIGYKDEFGQLYILGRNDSQIKIRGIRVEITEIESNILKITAIKEAAVLYYRNADKQDGQLIAFVVGDASQEIILSSLSLCLPDYMIPSKVIHLKELPKNKNNKTDRRALNELVTFNANSLPNDIEEVISDEIVYKLMQIWEKLFNHKFSATDDFFAIGGNSLMIMSLATQIQKIFNVRLSLSVFYEKRSVIELAEHIRFNMASGTVKSGFELVKGDYENNYFQLTHVQQAYILGRFGSYKLGGIATQRYVEYKFNQKLDHIRLQRALNVLIARHEMLRTTFSVEQMVQLIYSRFEYALVVNDYSDYAEDDLTTQILLNRKIMLASKFDVTHLPLFDIKISRGSSGDTLHFLSDILIMDANSLSIFKNELTALYQGSDIGAPIYSFRDYIESKYKLNNSPEYASMFYWFSRFKDIPNIKPLNTKVNPDTIKIPDFTRDSQMVKQQLWQNFKDKAYQNNLSPSSALLTIYYHVLSRYSETPNFLINISLFDKSMLSAKSNNIIGDFTDILAFLPYAGHTENFVSQVQKNHSLLWTDLEHRVVDGIEVFSIIRKKFNLDPSIIIAPLVFTSLLEDSQSEFFLERDSHEEFYLSQTAQVWIDNNATESGGCLISGWDYVSQLFDTKYVYQLHTAYIQLIEYFAVNNWDQEIPDINTSDVVTVINAANSSFQNLDKLITVKEQALIQPDSIAVIDSNCRISYGELLEKSYSIASVLHSLFIKSGELVAILSEKGYQQVVSAWGVMKIGAAYLPLNVEWPIGRMEDVLHEGQVKCMLISRKQLDKVTQTSIPDWCKIIVIEDIESGAYEDIVDIPIADLDKMAYVLFTSGSTGKPKGVVISYQGAINTIEAINRRFQVSNQDKILALSELSFDLSVYDIFGVLAAGGTIIFPDQDKVKEPSHWYELIEKHQITIWNTVPQIMQLLVDYVISHKKNLDSLCVVLLSGDWIPLTLPKQIKSLNPKITLMSLGGATEGSIWSCWYEIKDVNSDWVSIPYGVAMPNQKMYVLNSFGEHCPFGVIGEIYIGGIGVAIGYWNDQKKTSASFIEHVNLGRLYKTGDLGCWSSKGHIEFHGRKDYQVKINGYRIELEEITAKLNTIPGIDNSITQVVSYTGRDYIISYLMACSNYKKNDELNEFKLKKIGIRNDELQPIYRLNFPRTISKFTLRKSYRRYLAQKISDTSLIDNVFKSTNDIVEKWISNAICVSPRATIDSTILSEVLSSVSCVMLPERVLPKYLYPSAGSSYGVRVYLNLAKNVGEYISGYYYYNPLETTLNIINDNVMSHKDSLGEIKIDLVIYWPAIVPLYAKESRKFAYLEAGHMLALLLQQVDKYNIAATVEINEENLDAENTILASLILKPKQSTNFKADAELNKLFKNNEGVYFSDKHSVDITQENIFTRANWYSGRLLETGGLLIAFDGAESPENLVYAGIYFQLASELLYPHNIGSCMLGYEVYAGVLYAMILGAIDENEKCKPESIADDKPIKSYVDEYLSWQLPDYMLPYEYILLDKLPLTANGKVDLKQLPLPQICSNTSTYLAPENAIEAELCQIFADELGYEINVVGSGDDFFRLGGNSILAIRLSNRINNTFNSNIKVADVFIYKTVRHLALLIKNTIGKFTFKDYQIIQSNVQDLHLPFTLNNIQQAYYLGRYASFELGNISTHAYSEHQFSEIDVVKLEVAVNQLIKRHHGLRAIFRNGEQQYLETVNYYKIQYFEFTEYSDFILLREKLSHKVYVAENFPLFDFIVSKCCFNGQQDYYIFHISFDVLLMDGNSVRILYDELTDLYINPTLTLPELSVTYRDYILQLEEIRNGQLFNKDKEYWLNKLPEYNFELNLPLLCKPSEVKEPHFGRVSSIIPIEIWDKLKNKALAHDIGMTSVIMVIYGKVLSYWSNQQHLCINLTLFNRLPLHSQINQIIGDFTVLELFNFKNQHAQNSIIDELKSAHNELWQDIEHNLFDGVDFQRLIREEKGLSSNQVVAPVVLTSVLGDEYVNNKFLDNSYAGKSYSINQTSQVWLVNHAYISDAGFVTEWDYVEQLFATTMIQNMFDDYCKLIVYLAEADWNKDTFLLLNSPDMELIKKINTASRVIPKDTLFSHAMTFINTHGLNNKVAVVDSSATVEKLYEYQELFAKGTLLARRIIGLTIRNKSDSLIAILSEKGFNQVVGALAIMQSGSGYLPLNVEWPSQRLDEVLQSGNVGTVLISRNMVNSLYLTELKLKYQILVIEELLSPDFNSGFNESQIIFPEVKPDDIAYVIFTSGSTGKPKGVTISHRGALNTILAVNDRFKINSSDAIMALSELSFDLSVYDIFGMIFSGGTIVFPAQDKTKEPLYWQNLIKRHKISIWNSVPQLAELLIEDAKIDDLTSLRLLLLSGDWIPITLPSRLKQVCPSALTVSLGGATEGSIWSIWYEIDQPLDTAINSIPYGVAMPNQKIYILNYSMNHCPAGVIGDIYIGGLGVALNYYHDSEKTSVAFIDHYEFGRIYKTGDLGKLNANGYIEFLGRQDNQVKLNGYRVELGEIAAKLIQLNGIEDALLQIVVHENKNYLVAYVLLDRESGVDYFMLSPEQLKETLNNNLGNILPEYMLPYEYLILEKMPLTANGKVDVKQLPALFTGISITSYQSPVNELEFKIRDIFAEALGKNQSLIGTTDNFFQLGGDSIVAIRLISKLNQYLGLNLNVKDIFVFKNISALSKYISVNDVKDTGIIQEYEPFSLINLKNYTNLMQDYLVEDIYPASHLQLGMLFESDNSQYSTYHVVISNRVTTKFDKEKFLTVWKLLIEKHQLLRAGFILSENSYDCIIYQTIDLDYTIYDDCNTQELVSRERLHKFNYTSPGIFRILINQYADEFDMILSFHHAITDGWSISRLVNEFITAYYLDNVIKIAPNGITYATFVQQELMAINNTRHESFWREYLVSSIIPSINWADTVNETMDGLNYSSIRLDDSLSKEILTITNRLEVSTDSLFLFAYGLTLARFLNQTEIVVGLVMNNRLEYALGDELFGLFLNTLPCRLQINSGGFDNSIRSVYNQKLRLYDHKHFPYAKIKELFGHELYEFAFNYTNFQISSNGIKNSGSEDYQRSNIPFVLNVAKHPHGFIMDLIAHDNFCSQEYLNYIGKYLEHNLLSVLKQHDPSLLLNEDYEKQLGNLWNKTSINYPKHDTVVQLFAKQVVVTPNETALIYNNVVLTYAELNAKANQLAHFLITNYQIKADDLVTLCMERSEQIIIAILAVIKAGGAYVPIDSKYPPDRISYIIKDTRAKIVLTDVSCCNMVHKIVHEYDIEIKTDVPDILCIDEKSFINSLSEMSVTNPEIVISEHDLMYVIYTSGTTGQPKGVMIEHRGVVNLCMNMLQQHKLKQNKVVAIYSNYVFDAFVCELIPPLINGNKLILLSDNERLSLDLLSTIIIKHKVNLSFIPSALVTDFLNHIVDKKTSLKMIFSGGDKLPEINLEQIPDDLILVNEYGPTEATVCSTLHYLTLHSTNLTIGKPLDNISVYILDEQFQLLPIGAVGELYIGGDGLARGYLGKEQLTKEKFISNPYQTDDDKKHGKNTTLYKTGDLVKYRPDGDLMFIGRADTQVKINGHRIELSEIEATLVKIHSEIKNTFAIVDKARIIIYYVAEVQLDSLHLLDKLSAWLPDYMLPYALLQLDQLPLNVNGKVDHKLLPVFDSLQSNLNTYIAPYSMVQQQLCQIFTEVLNLNNIQVGVRDNFFHLGGNSILAIKLVAMLNRQFDINMKIVDVMANRNVGKLAQIISEKNNLAYSPLFKLNDTVDKPFMFMIHPGQAGCEVYLDMAKGLNGYYCCYGLDNYNLQHANNKFADLDSLARYYLDLIADAGFITNTTITLCGWSMGGLIALKMAAVLESQGYTNIRVYLLDTLIFDDTLCIFQDQMVDQKSRLQEHLLSQSYDAGYVDKIIGNFDYEIKLAKEQIRSRLNFTRVILFKAMREGNKFDGEVSNEMIHYILRLPSNNIENIITNPDQLQVISLDEAHHWNILEQQPVIDFLLSTVS